MLSVKVVHRHSIRHALHRYIIRTFQATFAQITVISVESDVSDGLDVSSIT